ncbi:MAG TPA: DEAD/DEAH box helicase [Marinilabiliales bacterium]|nr:MAG: DEAD/DEAH box helicase [Bacteroidetes bacterium GWA2_40_14]OFX65734.1 MAG: DEAD/DEAH box helicase [Bacteroidetes bacterium GWC2_40_13]OFX76117.1 MAG: DEAD/DEAH box helicase [Bacteroidetes bacterium GWD2_40_43]OFX94462.1 MAG: DEAD/DEAH box helicase [Bacteroidetes bacterium GWE2_40_63]OFY18932.1 MAG: DEAD/DEAH box helicase [Bacteroidetes bacterium GWF2_40_13]HAM99493.1 DEAD/DEAH box helicase [Marinilabiliales bacterium]
MTTFNEMGLSQEIYQAIDELGFISPTPIQEKTIPAILNSGTDLIALAQTGTGKTAGFGLPIIQQIDSDSKTTQALILCPTRELCLQITSDFEKYSKYTKGLSVLAVYGGASIVPQLNGLKSGAQVVVGTPGRTLDLINRKALKINKIKWMVLDEADEMLNMGFKEELDSILAVTPAEKQTLLFSATMPQGVRQIANNYMNKPEELSVGKKNSGADNVQHQYYMVKASDRYAALKRLADINPNIYGIVFCRTRKETKEVADQLIQDGYNADALHGDLSQAQRDHVMNRFRMKHLQLLIATDVAARGLDVNDLTHVINYNMPDDPEIYIHRSGRTGRAGKSGISMTIIHSRESRKIKDIEHLVGKKFEQKMVPGGREICEKRLYALIDIMEKVEVDDSQINSFLPEILKKLEWLDRDELIKRFVSVEFNHYLEYYRNATDLNVSKDGVSVKEKEKKRSAQGGFSRFFINLGTKDSLGAANLIGIINEYTSTRDIEIGKIDILRKFSFFEVDKNYEELILNSFKNATFGDVKIEVQLSKPESPDKRQDSSRSEGGFRKSNNYRKDRPSNDYKSKDKRSFGSAKPRFDKDKKRKRN